MVPRTARSPHRVGTLMPSSGEEDATHTQEASPAPRPNAFTPLPPLVVIVAGLLVVFLGGWWLGRVTAPEDTREVRGVITDMSESGSSVCIAPTMDPDIADVECQRPLVFPGDHLPPVGIRVEARYAVIPTAENDSLRLGVWLYLIPVSDE